MPASLLALLLAHALEHPKREVLALAPERLVLDVAWELPPGDEASELRRLFDGDRDGTLSAAEADRAAAWVADAATAFLSLAVDGVPVAPAREAVRGHGLRGRTADDSGLLVVVRLAAALPPPSGVRVVRLADRDRDASKHVPVRVELHGLALAGASPGAAEAGGGVDASLAIGQALEVAVVPAGGDR